MQIVHNLQNITILIWNNSMFKGKVFCCIQGHFNAQEESVPFLDLCPISCKLKKLMGKFLFFSAIERQAIMYLSVCVYLPVC